MTFFQKIYRSIKIKLFPLKETDPRQAYDFWSFQYDNQPDNLMLALDEQLFSTLLHDIHIKNKTIVDVGCGTGRHWTKMIEGEPKKTIGYDVSEGMLAVLKRKFPEADTQLLTGNRLGLEDNSAEIVISTLTIAHIENIREALHEWYRVLKPGGSILITDYHPVALSRGGKRTFVHNNKLMAVKNYVHPVEQLQQIAQHLHLTIIRLVEIKIDDSMRPWYEKQNAIPVFEKFKGTPIIFGIHLKKPDAAA